MNHYIALDQSNASTPFKSTSDKRAIATAKEHSAVKLLRVWCGGQREIELGNVAKPDLVSIELQLQKTQAELQASKQQAIHLHNALMMIESAAACGLDDHSRKVALEMITSMVKNALEKHGIKRTPVKK